MPPRYLVPPKNRYDQSCSKGLSIQWRQTPRCLQEYTPEVFATTLISRGMVSRPKRWRMAPCWWWGRTSGRVGSSTRPFYWSETCLMRQLLNSIDIVPDTRERRVNRSTKTIVSRSVLPWRLLFSRPKNYPGDVSALARLIKNLQYAAKRKVFTA